MVVDNVPAGALSEPLPVLPELVDDNVHLILGLRDIIDEPSVVRHQWHAADNYTIVRQYYSDIWIYGDRSFYDLSLDLAPEPSVYRKISFLGYPDVPLSPSVLQDEQFQSLISRPFVLCLTGEGRMATTLHLYLQRHCYRRGWTVLFLPVARWLGRK